MESETKTKTSLSEEVCTVCLVPIGGPCDSAELCFYCRCGLKEMLFRYQEGDHGWEEV